MGNEYIGAYQVLSLSHSDNGYVSYVFGGNYSQGIYENVIANPEVTWRKLNT